MQLRPNPAGPDTEGKLIGMGWIFFVAIGILLPSSPTRASTELAGFFTSERVVTGGLSQSLGKADRNGTQIAESALVGGYSDL